MIRNYFALYELARELSDCFAGGYIFECFSQEKGELRVSLFSKEKERYTLIGTTGESRLALYYCKDFARKRRNSIALMREANDKEIKRVRISDSDRIIYMDLEEDYQLAFQLFSADTNFFLLKNQVVIESFKKNEVLKETTFKERLGSPIFQRLEYLINNKSEFMDLFKGKSPNDFLKVLPLVVSGFDSALSREAIYRAGKKGDPLSLESIHTSVSELFYELISPQPTVYFGEVDGHHEGFWFSIISELHRQYSSAQHFESINEAMMFYSHKVHQEEHFGKALKGSRQQLERLIQKKKMQIASLEEQSTVNRGATYEAKGKLLIANIHLLEKGKSQVELENLLNGEKEVISLDSKKTPYQNAEMYFEKAKKSKVNERVSLERLNQARLTLSELLILQSEIAQVDSQKDYDNWYKKNLVLLKKHLIVSKAEADKQMLFRRFHISPTVELWVGKNSKNNDLLTFKYARPNDLWLHARGVSGSHCVLKSNKQPSKVDVERAAEIAAYYSSAKGSELVPVIFTQKKFVRKPKSAEPGSVVALREEVILVKPKRFTEGTGD